MYSHSMHGNAYLCIGTSGSIVVVVSPLIGLMMDQKAAFLSKGISAEVAGSLQGHASAESIVNGNAQLALRISFAMEYTVKCFKQRSLRII